MGMITDPIADALTRIRNAQLATHKTVTVRGSKLVRSVLDVLKTEGFVESVKERKEEGKPGVKFEVTLKYYNGGEPMIASARRISTPGRRTYSRVTDLPRVQRGLGISILSTSQGVMSDREARKRKIGGEIIASIG